MKIISYGILALITIFSLATVHNVYYFVQSYHEGVVGLYLGLGLGAALFVCAFVAAQGKSQETRRIGLTGAVAFGLTSGYFQFSVYSETAQSTNDMVNAFLLAFVPLIFGEAGLALLESSIVKDEQVEDKSQIVPVQEQVKKSKPKVKNVPKSKSKKQSNMDEMMSIIRLEGDIGLDFVDRLNVSKQTVYNYYKELEKEGKISQNGSGYVVS